MIKIQFLHLLASSKMILSSLILQESLDEAFKERVTVADLFKTKANFKALIYTCVLASFQQLTGINVVLFYMQNIFKAAGSSIPDSQAPIIIGAVQMVASAVTPFVVDRGGRRILLVFSGIGETISLVINFFEFLDNYIFDIYFWIYV